MYYPNFLLWKCPQIIPVSLHSLDLKTLSLERVEILLRVVPNEKEVKEFKQYEREKKPLAILSDEDKFIYSVSLLCFLKLGRLYREIKLIATINPKTN